MLIESWRFKKILHCLVVIIIRLVINIYFDFQPSIVYADHVISGRFSSPGRCSLLRWASFSKTSCLQRLLLNLELTAAPSTRLSAWTWVLFFRASRGSTWPRRSGWLTSADRRLTRWRAYLLLLRNHVPNQKVFGSLGWTVRWRPRKFRNCRESIPTSFLPGLSLRGRSGEQLVTASQSLFWPVCSSKSWLQCGMTSKSELMAGWKLNAAEPCFFIHVFHVGFGWLRRHVDVLLVNPKWSDLSVGHPNVGAQPTFCISSDCMSPATVWSDGFSSFQVWVLVGILFEKAFPSLCHCMCNHKPRHVGFFCAPPCREQIATFRPLEILFLWRIHTLELDGLQSLPHWGNQRLLHCGVPFEGSDKHGLGLEVKVWRLQLQGLGNSYAEGLGQIQCQEIFASAMVTDMVKPVNPPIAIQWVCLAQLWGFGGHAAETPVLQTELWAAEALKPQESLEVFGRQIPRSHLCAGTHVNSNIWSSQKS